MILMMMMMIIVHIRLLGVVATVLGEVRVRVVEFLLDDDVVVHGTSRHVGGQCGRVLRQLWCMLTAGDEVTTDSVDAMSNCSTTTQL